jgi:FdhE protein
VRASYDTETATLTIDGQPAGRVPLKAALEGVAEGLDPARFEGWKEGYCPVCGSRAGMDELSGEEGHRRLSCSACFFRWPWPRIRCPYCGNDDPETVSYFTAGEGPVRVGVCRKCSRYIKTRDARLGNASVPMEAEDLATLHLDLLAGREGFERGK